MSKIKSVSSFNGTSWDAAVPLGADDTNIDVTTATHTATEYSSDTTDTLNGLLLDSAGPAPGEALSTSLSKINRFRQRVVNNFGRYVESASIKNAYAASPAATDLYAASVINSYMSNVIGYTGTTAPTAGSVSSQLTTLNNSKLSVVVADTRDLNSYTTRGIYLFAGNTEISNAPGVSSTPVNGVLEVHPITTTVFIQIWYRAGSSPNTFKESYKRLYNGSSGFSDWEKFTTATDLSTGLATKLNLSGGTLTGNLVVGSSSTNKNLTVNGNTTITGNAAITGNIKTSSYIWSSSTASGTTAYMRSINSGSGAGIQKSAGANAQLAYTVDGGSNWYNFIQAKVSDHTYTCSYPAKWRSTLGVPQLSYKTFEVDNISIAANDKNSQNTSITNGSKVPIAIGGWKLANASSNGTNGSQVCATNMYLNIPDQTFQWQLKNVSSSAAKVKITFSIVYTEF